MDSISKAIKLPLRHFLSDLRTFFIELVEQGKNLFHFSLFKLGLAHKQSLTVGNKSFFFLAILKTFNGNISIPLARKNIQSTNDGHGYEIHI